MAKITGKYEVLYIIDPTLGEEGTAALVEKFKAMVEAEGTLASVDEWGKRRLAYPINDMAEGYYVLMNFESKPEQSLTVSSRSRKASCVPSSSPSKSKEAFSC